MAQRHWRVERFERWGPGMVLIGTVVNLNRPAQFVHVGHWFQMSVPNIVVIVVMLVVFALAIGLPFPGRGGRRSVS